MKTPAAIGTPSALLRMTKIDFGVIHGLFHKASFNASEVATRKTVGSSEKIAAASSGDASVTELPRRVEAVGMFSMFRTKLIISRASVKPCLVKNPVMSGQSLR